MRLKSYADFRHYLKLNNLTYEINEIRDAYIITDLKGNELITLDGYTVRNAFDKVRDELITAVTVHEIFDWGNTTTLFKGH